MKQSEIKKLKLNKEVLRNIIAIAVLVIGFMVATTVAFAEDGQTTSTYVVSYNTNNADVVDAIVNAGGTVIADYQEINLMIAESDNPDFATAVSKNKNVKFAVQDVMVQWIPDVQGAEVNVQSLDMESIDVSPAGDPWDADFYWMQWNIPITDTDDAWDITQGDPEVKVAVLDTGIDPYHIDLQDKIDADESASFVPAASACGPGWIDYHYHGTWTAGIISTNNIGTAGIAPNVRLRAVKVLDCSGSGMFSWVIGGIIHAVDTDNDIISMSLSGYFPVNNRDFENLGRLQGSLNKAVNYAQTQGVLVVSAAGNGGIDLDKDKNCRCLPCQSGSGMCVGSTTSIDALSYFSNHGLSGPQIVAPGGGFPTTGSPRVWAPCSSQSVIWPFNVWCSGGDVYVGAYGTSASAPHVAGAAALLDSVAPKGPGSYRGGQLRNMLLQGADDLGKNGADNIYSHGRLNTYGAVTK